MGGFVDFFFIVIIDVIPYAKNSVKHLFIEGAFHPQKSIKFFHLFGELSAKSGKQKVYFPNLLVCFFVPFSAGTGCLSGKGQNLL